MNCKEKKLQKKLRIDCHVHIFPDAVKTERAQFFDDPSFVLLYKNKKARIENAEALICAMDTEGIDISCAMGFPWKDPDRLSWHNDAILHAAEEFPGRILPFCCINPESEGALSEAKRCLDAGAAGLGEIACYKTDFTNKMLDQIAPVMALCRERDVPLFFHVNDPLGHDYPGKAPITSQGTENLVLRFQENRIVLAHGGGGYPFYHLVRKGLSGHPDRLFFDTAAFPFLYKTEIYRELLRILGKNRLLFGSDWPLLSPGRYFSEMCKNGLSEEEMDAVCGENALKFLKMTRA